VTYERAACTHGDPRTIVEIEGTQGCGELGVDDWTGEGAVRKPRIAAVNRPAGSTSTRQAVGLMVMIWS
jgi:hypothetical protein